MSLQAIIEKIKSDSEAEANEILAEAEKRVSEIRQETDRKIGDIKAGFQTEFKKKSEHYENVTLSLEKQKANLAVQTEKRRVLDEVFSEALSSVLALSSSDYVSILTERYKNILPKNIEVVSVLSPDHRQSESSEILKALGVSAPLVVSARLKGGLVFVGSDFEFDLSIEKLFSEIRSSSEIEIAKNLFQK
ncbi:MAG: V-type proton ATPase subunit E [Parcubacteria bacterium OLB19]|nr:MAG: V-type proton ATPase subunit E [Parcubacteria bacterium OLB19]